MIGLSLSSSVNTICGRIMIGLSLFSSSVRERPFSLKGGLCFFLKKYSDSQFAEKNILILVKEKKISLRVFVI